VLDVIDGCVGINYASMTLKRADWFDHPCNVSFASQFVGFASRCALCGRRQPLTPPQANQHVTTSAISATFTLPDETSLSTSEALGIGIAVGLVTALSVFLFVLWVF
jgi:hypothetical protein